LTLKKGEVYEIDPYNFDPSNIDYLAEYYESVESLKISIQIDLRNNGEEVSNPEIFDHSIIPEIEALFTVGYGAMRRVERLPSYEIEAQNQQYSYRYSRMANLFDSRVVLTPLVSWLPQLPKSEKKQILELFASLMPAKLEFSDSIDGREFSFYHNKILVPFDALADGHRSYIGWVSDLLYHLHRANPKNVQDVHGVVLVDEVDLLAHPTWQRTIVPDLSKAFPKLQFILTTHSPIVAASVEAANLFILEPGRNGTARLTRPDAEVYGLNAQQVLHEVFGMDSTRAPDFDQKLKTLAKKSRGGDRAAAQALMQGLAYGAGEPVQLEDDSELASIQKAAKALLESDS
jgi:AAA domain, putative AbiEii toxin, Type IV TA system